MGNKGYGFPCSCVSFKLAKDGELMVGVVYDPMRDELFTAEKGKVACWLVILGYILEWPNPRRMMEHLEEA